MERGDLNEKLEEICERYLEKPKKGRKTIKSLFKNWDNEKLKEWIKDYDDVSSGLAQSVLYMRGENRIRFKGPYAGAFITVKDSKLHFFEGSYAGTGILFKGENSGRGNFFEGYCAGMKSIFKGKNSGRCSFFKGSCAGKDILFMGENAGLGSSFEGDWAGKGASFKRKKNLFKNKFKGVRIKILRTRN